MTDGLDMVKSAVANLHATEEDDLYRLLAFDEPRKRYVGFGTATASS